jgi:hypothetical protein
METSIQYLPADSLQAWSRNPKKHDKKAMVKSLERFGFTAPVLLDETTGRIIAGHGRVEAVLELKASGKPAPLRIRVDGDSWFVPVVRGLSFASEAEAEAYLVADNRLTEIGGWDDDMLMAMLSDIQVSAGDEAFAGTGFTDREVENLMRKTDVERDQGPTVEEKADGFVNATIKQIVLFYDSETYDSVLDRLNAAMQATGVKNHTDLVTLLLEKFEAGNADSSAEEG